MAGSRPSRTGRVAASASLTHMCHYVHPADQRDLHLALLQTNDHQAIPFQAAKLRREFARNSERQKILLGAPPTSQSEEGVSVHNGGSARG